MSDYDAGLLVADRAVADYYEVPVVPAGLGLLLGATAWWLWQRQRRKA